MIFDNDLFILYSASYKLNNFQDRYNSNFYNVKGDFINSINKSINLGLLPSLATQTLVFKRVTNKNLTHADICSPEKLQKVNSDEIMGIPIPISGNIPTFNNIPKTTIPTELKPF